MKTLLLWGLFLIGQLSYGQPELSLSLKEAQQRAMTTSSRVEQFRLQLEKIRYDLGVRNFLPRLSVGFSQNDSTVIDSGDSYDKQLYMNIKETIFDGGKTLRDRTLSKLSLGIALRSLEMNRQAILEEVWELYHNLSVSQKKLNALLQAFERATNEQNISQAREAIGEITELDVLDVKVQVASLGEQLDEARLTQDDLSTQLRELLGLDARISFNLTDPLEETWAGFVVTETPENFLKYAESGSLDYAQLLLKKRELQTQQEALTWSWMPSIELDTTLSASGANFPLRQPGVNVSLSLNFPVSGAPINVSIGGGIQGEVSRSRSATASTEILSDLSPVVAQSELGLNAIELTTQIEKWKRSILDQANNFIEGHKIRIHKLATLREALKLETQKASLMELRLKLGEIKPGDLVLEQGRVLETQLKVWNAVLDLMLQERRFQTLVGLPEFGLQRLGPKP